VTMYIFGAGFVLALLVGAIDSHAGLCTAMALLPAAQSPVATPVVIRVELVRRLDVCDCLGCRYIIPIQPSIRLARDEIVFSDGVVDREGQGPK